MVSKSSKAQLSRYGPHSRHQQPLLHPRQAMSKLRDAF
jgi:hypothetical protein